MNKEFTFTELNTDDMNNVGHWDFGPIVMINIRTSDTGGYWYQMNKEEYYKKYPITNIEKTKQDYFDRLMNPPAVEINPVAYGYKECPQKEKDMDMNYEIQATNAAKNADHEAARRALLASLENAYDKASRDGYKKFNINVDATPRTIKELKEKLAKSEYKLDTQEYEDDHDNETLTEETEFDWFTQLTNHIIWVNPSRLPDRAGHKTFKEELEKKYNDARLEIKVLEPEKGLESFRRFQSTYH